MSCSGHHFSVHSPDCKAHMSIASNRPIQVDPVASSPGVQVLTIDASDNGRSQDSLVRWHSPIVDNGAEINEQANLIINSSRSPSKSPAFLHHHQQQQVNVTGRCSSTNSNNNDNNYTLVILDCSPHPSDGADLMSASRDNSPYASGRNVQQAAGGCAAGECAHTCHCQTELIVRQHIEHDHNCQHTCAPHQQQQQRTTQLYSGGSGSLADRSASQATSCTIATRPSASRETLINLDSNNLNVLQDTTNKTTTTTTTTTVNKSTQQHEYNNNYSTGVNRNHVEEVLLPAQNENIFNSWQQQYYGHNTSTSPRSSENYNNTQQNEQNSQPLITPTPTTTSGEQNKNNQRSQTTTTRDGTKLVKRWDWNRAQFVEEEVPIKAAPIPRTIANSGNQPTKQRNTTTNTNMSDAWNREIDAICSQLSPTPNVQYDPSWLAYRKPDEQSVQSDPLYRDLMLELKRLEEGVTQQAHQDDQHDNSKQQQQQATTYWNSINATPDCQQKPVFGQPLQPDNVELNEGESVELIARLIPNSDPTMRVEWTLNGRPLLESSRLTSEYEFGVVRLVIRPCEAEDSGIYECRAINALGESVSRAKLLVHAQKRIQCETLHPAGMELIRQLENPKQVERPEEPIVQQAPKFMSHIRDYVEKDEGDSVHFECCLAPVDDPDMKTEWFFNGRPLVTGSRFHTIDDFGFIVLDIDWLFPRDTGEYICRATNKFGTDFTRTVLRVRPDKNIVLDSQLTGEQAHVTIDKLRQLEFPDVEPEPLAPREPDRPAHFVEALRTTQNKRNYQEGDNVHFEARVGPASDGQLSVEWFHNGRPLISGHRFKPTFDFGHILLDILYVYAEDSGTYKCVARNEFGEASSEFDIRVLGKPSLVYQSQLPKEMSGGVAKITEMEAMWNRAPDPEEEEAPLEREAPAFVLEPKACVAFEGSCARFTCRIIGRPRPRVQWFINEQLVVSGSRYKLTHDGMYILTIPKCQLSDAGTVRVQAKNLLGECSCTTQLEVKRKVDDYRGVLKNSPNPWYDEQALKMYRRQRNQSLDGVDDDNEMNFDADDYDEFLQKFQRHQRNQLQQQQQQTISSAAATTAAQQQCLSPTTVGQQLVGYMDPDTPDINLLMSSRSPLVEPGDLHPVVIEQQAIMAPAPSTVQRALNETSSFATQQQQQASSGLGKVAEQQAERRVFGLVSSGGRANASQASTITTTTTATSTLGNFGVASPENVEHGKEVHSHFHKQLQVEHRPNKEITREIIEKETFEQEHRGYSRDNIELVRDNAESPHPQGATERATSVTPTRTTFASNQTIVANQHEQQVLVDEHMIPPEFVQKIQPCQAIDGDEARFECAFTGSPRPTISWFRDDKLIKASNLYSIQTDFQAGKSTLIIKRVTLGIGNALYTVKAENAAGSAKSSANLVVEEHPLPQTSRGGHARQFDALDHMEQSASTSSGHNNLMLTDVRGCQAVTKLNSRPIVEFDLSQQEVDEMLRRMENDSVRQSIDSSSQSTSNTSIQQQQQSKVIKSVRTRRMSPDEMTSLIRASPDNLVAPTFLHTIHEIHVRPGELARLDARLIGSQPMDVRWLKDGQRVRADTQHKLVLEGDLYTLLILEPQLKHEGFYECVASNAIGEARCGATLRVSPDGRLSSSSMGAGSSSFAAETSSLLSAAGSKAIGRQLKSSSSSSTTTTTTSTVTTTGQANTSQQEQQQQQQQRKHFGLTNKPHHLLMSEYTTTNAEQQQQQLTIPKLIRRLDNQQVREGKSVTLRCQISAYPKAEIFWFKQNNNTTTNNNNNNNDNKQQQLIKPSKYFRIFKDNDETHCLKILETFAEDQGEYKCVARSQNGQVETSATITVIPNSPR